jgi:hypothetical protein
LFDGRRRRRAWYVGGSRRSHVRARISDEALVHRVFEAAFYLLKVTKDIHRALREVDGLTDRGLWRLPDLARDKAVPSL